jgi:hypothetical protein
MDCHSKTLANLPLFVVRTLPTSPVHYLFGDDPVMTEAADGEGGASDETLEADGRRRPT